MGDAGKSSMLIDRSGGSVPPGMCAYNILYQEDGPMMTVTVTVVIAEQGSEAANRRRAWDEARVMVGRFIAQRPSAQDLS